MKTTKEKIAVMQHYDDGGDVIYDMTVANKNNSRLNFNWERYDYNIYNKPDYVPYTVDDAEEFRDKWFKSNVCSTISKPTGYNNEDIIIARTWYPYQAFFDKFTHEDGTPAGKLKEV